jgi:hypothetical protein
MLCAFVGFTLAAATAAICSLLRLFTSPGFPHRTKRVRTECNCRSIGKRFRRRLSSAASPTGSVSSWAERVSPGGHVGLLLLIDSHFRRLFTDQPEPH